MAISPVLFNGSVSRMQDVTQIKQNEDMKGMVDQTNFQNTFHKQIDHKLNQVHHSDNAENRQKKFDAKDKGDNEYSGDGVFEIFYCYSASLIYISTSSRL